MLIAQEISRRMKSELGITVSVGVSFNKIFAKLGSDYKKPDAITTMYKSEFKQKAWSLPVADLLYVGKSTNRKLALFGENGFRRRVVEISVRDNELFSFTCQKKIDHATNITGEIATYAYQIFKENYNWSKPIRSVGVRGADLVTDNYWEQIDLFSNVEKREKQMKMDSAVDEIRRRFGFYSIQRGLMYRDRILSAVNAKEEHTVHPHGYFLG